MDRVASRALILSRRRLLQSGIALASLGLVVGCSRLARPEEPPSKIHRVGFLADFPDTYFVHFLDGLSELGYVDGESVLVERRYAQGDYARFPALIAELEGLGAECIVCGGLLACTAAKGSNTLVPQVSWILTQDALDEGLVQSIARPEGRMTGLAGVSGRQFFAKVLEILNMAVPGAGRVGILSHAPVPGLSGILDGLEEAAGRLGLPLEIAKVDDADGIEPAFTTLVAAGARALMVTTSLLFITADVRLQIAELSRAHRLPVASTDTALPQAGGLLAYSVNRPDSAHRTAWYVDKLLKGAKPAELPMERPNKFDLINNLKTAQALGLTIPPSVSPRLQK